MEKKKVNPSVKTYINKIENRVLFKIKIGYYLTLLTPEAKKLLGSTKTITINKWGKCTFVRNY